MKSSRTLAAAIAAGALIAIPATASASSSASASAGDVKSYTVKADRALDRAVSMFARGNDRPALKSFRQSRAYLGKAKAISAKLAKTADTDAERTRAAQAWRYLAIERDQNLSQLVKLLEKVNAKTDKIVATALLADTKHRDIAIGVIQDLIDAGISEKAVGGFNRVLAALTSGRAAEIGAQINVLAEVKLPADAQKKVALSIQANLTSQARVAALLDELIPQLPEESRTQLEEALELVNSQLAAAAEMMDEVAELVPPFVRPLVQGVLDDVKAIIEAVTAPWTEEVPETPAETPPVEAPPVTETPETPGVEVPKIPLPFPVPMPSFVLDIINSILPGGLPVETAPMDLPFMNDFFENFFGEGGMLGGLFGGGAEGGMLGGLFGGSGGTGLFGGGAN